MNNIPLYLSIVGLFVLAACSSAEERARMRAQKEMDICIDRGLEQGTDAFESCRLDVRTMQQRRVRERMNFNDDFRPSPPPQQSYKW